MIDPQAAVFARLTGDATLVGQLAVYGGAAAVFEEGRAPADLQIGALPVALVTPSAHQFNDDTLSAGGRIERIDVRLYARPAASTLALHTAAERVRTLLQNWGPASLTGGALVNCTVLGPQPAPTDDPSLDGRILIATLLIRET